LKSDRKEAGTQSFEREQDCNCSEKLQQS
jgi:hypothetical protein